MTTANERIPLDEQLIDRATRAHDPVAAVISALRTAASYIQYAGRGENDETFEIRKA